MGRTYKKELTALRALLAEHFAPAETVVGNGVSRTAGEWMALIDVELALKARVVQTKLEWRVAEQVEMARRDVQRRMVGELNSGMLARFGPESAVLRAAGLPRLPGRPVGHKPSMETLVAAAEKARQTRAKKKGMG